MNIKLELSIWTHNALESTIIEVALVDKFAVDVS